MVHKTQSKDLGNPLRPMYIPYSPMDHSGVDSKELEKSRCGIICSDVRSSTDSGLEAGHVSTVV